MEVQVLDGKTGANAAGEARPGRRPRHRLARRLRLPRQQPSARVRPEARVQVGGLPTTHARPRERRPGRRPCDRRERSGRRQEALRAVAVDPRDRARGRRGRHPGDGGSRHRGDDRSVERSRRARESSGPRLAGQPELRADPEEDDRLLHLSRTPTAGAAARSPRAASSSSATTATESTSTATGPTSASRSAPTAACPSPRAARCRRTSATSRATPVSSTPATTFTASREADALSYTLLPHGSHDFAKDQRIRAAAIAIHNASEQALLWSPIVQPNDAPQGGGAPCVTRRADGDACAQIYGQTWGTVYDTINYTTTGALGDYFDSSIGVNADGIDNEMSFSHLDKNIIFEPQTEQLHVAGNKALIFARLAQLAAPRIYRFVPNGTQAYVPNNAPHAGCQGLPAGSARGLGRADRHQRDRHDWPGRQRRRPVHRQGWPAAGRWLAGREQEHLQRRHARRRDRGQRPGGRHRHRPAWRSNAAAATSTRASPTTTSG